MPGIKVFSDLGLNVNNATAACFLATVSNSTAASFLTTVSNSTPASLLATVSNSTAGSFLATVSNPTAACFLATINNSTAASFVTQLGARTTTEASEAVTSAVTTFAHATTQTILGQTDVTFTVLNNSSAANTAQVKISLSPDGSNFADDPSTATVNLAQNSMAFLVPGRFVKYATISYAAATAGNTVSLSIWFQAQV